MSRPRDPRVLVGTVAFGAGATAAWADVTAFPLPDGGGPLAIVAVLGLASAFLFGGGWLLSILMWWRVTRWDYLAKSICSLVVWAAVMPFCQREPRVSRLLARTPRTSTFWCAQVNSEADVSQAVNSSRSMSALVGPTTSVADMFSSMATIMARHLRDCRSIATLHVYSQTLPTFSSLGRTPTATGTSFILEIINDDSQPNRQSPLWRPLDKKLLQSVRPAEDFLIEIDPSGNKVTIRKSIR